MNNQKFLPIDLIIVNFYPFQKTVIDSKNSKNIIENIDIGGPTMVRAAAKNFKNVSIVTNRDDYKSLIKELETFKGKTSLKFREIMSSKAFGLTAYYDAMIANWFNNKLNIYTIKNYSTLDWLKNSQKYDYNQNYRWYFINNSKKFCRS